MSDYRVDLKGKYYTDRVAKRDVEVIISTNHHLIKGVFHLTPDNRIKDDLNGDERFIAVTQAQVYDPLGKNLLYQSEFIALNKDMVIWVLPKETLGTPQK